MHCLKLLKFEKFNLAKISKKNKRFFKNLRNRFQKPAKPKPQSLTYVLCDIF